MTRLAEEYPKQTACGVLGLARSTAYHTPPRVDETSVQQAIREIGGEFPCYGYRRVAAELKRRAQPVNAKRVRRLMAEMGLQAKRPAKKRRTTNSDHPYPRYANCVQQLDITRPDQVWAADLTYIRLQRDFVYLAVLMDVHTRTLRGWHLSRDLDHTLTLTALQRALADHQPELHHSDQGVQYAASGYTDLLVKHGIQISMAEVGEPTQNGYAERLMRTIKEEEVDLSDYQDFADAYRQIGRFLDDVYMHKRVHSSLKYLTPAEFESQCRNSPAGAGVVM